MIVDSNHYNNQLWSIRFSDLSLWLKMLLIPSFSKGMLNMEGRIFLFLPDDLPNFVSTRVSPKIW